MRTASALACLMACALLLDGQIVATLDRSSDGLEELRIRNNSATALVAFVVTAKHQPESSNTIDAPLVVYSDPLIDSTAMPLAAGEERVVIGGVRTTGRSRRLEEPIVAAGILVDGSTTGDAALLTRLIWRRSNMLQAVETARGILSDAARHNVPRDQLIEQFRKMAASVDHWYLPPEQQVGRSLYQSIIGKLMNLPEVEAGSPFPPATFVEKETAALSRERLTLLESKPSLADALLIEGR